MTVALDDPGLYTPLWLRIPSDEPKRLDSLRSYGILDTAPEANYDELVELAARICGTPVAYIKFIDESRAWFKSKVGFPPAMTEVPREVTVCSWTICQSDLVVVRDLAADDRFRECPCVAGPPNCRFYCGMPLINEEGYALGTFCVIDFEAREISFEQQEAIRTLAHQAASLLELRRAAARLTASIKELEDARSAAEVERTRADDLLRNVLPGPVADELKATGHVQARYYPLVTVLFTDFQGFTKLAATMEPARLVQTLDQFFRVFDDIVEHHGLEKIKTVGDSYMCAGGVPTPGRAHVVDACLAAVGMQAAVTAISAERVRHGLEAWEMRIGLHAGPVMTGIVGRRQFTYDVWGDVVNVAQRLEAAGEPGKINVSDAVYHRVRHLFEFSPRGAIEVRGKGPLSMYFLNGINPELSDEGAGECPNERFAIERHRV